MDTKRLIIVAVGGQGNLLASRVLGEASLLADIPVRMSEIHGMAQRGGVVESAIVFGDAESTIISDGEADILVGFEPSETLRAMNKCNGKTIVITNLAPLPPFTVAIGRGVYPDIDNVQNLIRQKAAENYLFRQIFPLVRRKYLSLMRKSILENARKLIHINKTYIKLFGNDLFPVLRI